MDCSPSGSSVHGILRTRILERVAMRSSRGPSWPRNWTWVSCIMGRLLYGYFRFLADSSDSYFPTFKYRFTRASLEAQLVKNLPNIGDPGLIPGSRRSLGGGNGNPLQYSCLENPMDRGAQQAIAHGVTKSWTWLKQFSILLQCFPVGTSGKEHICQCRRLKRCRFNPWVGKIPRRRKWQPILVFMPGKFHRPRRLAGYSPWSHRIRHDWATNTHTHTYTSTHFYRLPGGPNSKELTCQCRRHKRCRFNHWVRKKELATHSSILA